MRVSQWVTKKGPFFIPVCKPILSTPKQTLKTWAFQSGPICILGAFWLIRPSLFSLSFLSLLLCIPLCSLDFSSASFPPPLLFSLFSCCLYFYNSFSLLTSFSPKSFSSVPPPFLPVSMGSADLVHCRSLCDRLVQWLCFSFTIMADGFIQIKICRIKWETQQLLNLYCNSNIL